MKKYTNKIIAGVVAALVLLLLVSIAVPYAARDWLFVSKPIGDTRPEFTNLELTGFDSISVSGDWTIRIKEGAQYSVRLSVPQAFVHNACEVKNGELILRKIADNMSSLSPQPQLEITMPRLNAVTISGASSIFIEGFNSEKPQKFTLTMNGATDFKMIKSKFSDVRIDCQGASSIDIGGCELHSAIVNVSGASRIKLGRLTGGDLSGSLDGVAVLEYYGDVRSNNISASGLASVNKR